MVYPKERERSPTIYVLTGVAIALLLELLNALIGNHTADLLGDAIHQAVRAAGRTLTFAEMSSVKGQFSGWLFAETAARGLVAVCQCGLAFWIGRKTAPRWGWGIWVAIPHILRGLSGPFWLLQWGTGWMGYLHRAFFWLLLYTAAIAIAAFLGGSFRTKKRL